MRIRYRILALAAAALLSGCAKESAVMNLPEAEKVTVQIKTKALTGSVVEGVTIEKVRFMLFQNETLLNNYTTSNGTLNVDDSGLFNLAVSPGVYSFAAIINETPELTEKLNAVTKRTDIDGIEFDWQSSALTSGNMPLANLGEIKIQPGTTSGQGMAQLRPVYNSEGGRYKGDFTTASTTIRMEQTTRQKPPTQIMPLIYLSTQPTGAYPLRTRYCFVKEMLISGSFVIPITMCMLQLSK